MEEDSGRFDALLQEDRTFPPPEEFTAQANISDPRVYEEAANDPESFWAKFADELDWFKKWDTVLDWNPPYAKWFIGGKLNVLQLYRSPSNNKPTQQGSTDLGRRTWRPAGLHLLGSIPRSLPIRKWIKKPGREKG